jgi:V-type H+-transporting ATPase subunit a
VQFFKNNQTRIDLEDRYDCLPLFNPNNTKDYDQKAFPYPGPYPFGLDPEWHGAKNELVFQNSMKMKISVLFGVAQMLLGVVLKFLNSLHFRSKLDLFFECIPQLLFLVCAFGFMDYMVMYKWVNKDTDEPSIINIMISERNLQSYWTIGTL